MGFREADLTPSLGWPGGPCQVVERIENEVGNPRLKLDLAEKVELGRKLTNPEASKVYTMETERGGGLFRQIKITPHAQYRMDQRNITVLDLRLSLTNYSKKLNDWKSQRSWQWDEFERNTMRGESLEWTDKKHSDLRIIFRNQRGTAIIISTYWVGLSDPRPETCDLHPRHARTVEDMSGYRTMVKTPSPNKSDTGDTSKNNGKYPIQGLPAPPWSRSKPTRGPTVLNTPGESGSDSSGSIHKDKVRTPGVPGGQYDGGNTHPLPPYNNTGITPQRRPGLTAEDPDWIDEETAFLLEEQWDEEQPLTSFPEDDGGQILAGMYPPAYPGSRKQREQKGRAYMYFHKRYMRTRGRVKQKQKRRHKRLRSNGRYKADRERREKKPERFERRPGGGAKSIAERGVNQRKKQKNVPSKNRQDTRTKRASLPVPFFHFPTGLHGVVIEVSPCGFIHFDLDEVGRDVASFDTFFNEVVIDDDRLDELFDYMDEVFEFGEVGEDDFYDEEDDPLFDSWLTDGLSKVAYAGFRLKRRPDKRRRRQRGQDKVKSKLRYRQNRMRSKMKSRKRYKRLKKNPQFKKQQQIRRKHPERFKMRIGEVLTAPEIAFVFELLEENLVLGYVRNISGMTGLVQFYTVQPNKRMLRSMPVREFLAVVTFLSEEDENAMYDLVDAEVGIEAYGDPEALGQSLVNLYITESDFLSHPKEKRNKPDPLDETLRDPTDDDFYYGAVIKLANEVIASFFREVRPPQMDPDTVYDRANDHDDRKRRKRKPGDPGFYSPHEEEVHDSNPGSRVLPSGKGHVEKQAKFNLRTLPPECRDGLMQLIRTRAWKKYVSTSSLRGGDAVLDFLQKHGWDTLSRDGMWKLFQHLHRMASAPRTAAFIRDIREGCGPNIQSKASGLSIKLARVDAKNGVWLFNVQGSTSPYRVRLKAMRKGNVRDLQKTHVRVSCSCPFWQWQGPEFYAKQGDYLFGKARGLASKPSVKDPNGQHRVCKHVLAVFNHVTSNKWQVPKQRKQGARYLADIVRLGEMSAEYPEFEMRRRKVAARYLASMEVRHVGL